GILQKSFRQMTDNLKALQEENQHQQRVELELEFRALLSQIQPHFVKNTLAAINGLALQGDSTRILQLVDSLGYFLSTRIYQGRAIV
ncbi:histidine kinase, partial [Bacillus cereus]|nr:histidine kinase [Bacillus cereus]